MWQQVYTPVAGSLPLSTLAAALPIATLLYLLGVRRSPSWVAALAGLGTAAAVALFAYGMPVSLLAGAIGYGAAFGLFPIGWVVFWALILYEMTLITGRFEVLKDSIGSLTSDPRLQALLIAFAFGAFIEGAAGFGTPVAVAAAMLTGLGFSPFYAAGICLLANTAPVAFGSLGTPIIALEGVTKLPQNELSAWVGRICAPVSLIVPTYLIAVMTGRRGLMGVIPAVAVCGISFAGMQFLASNYLGAQVTDIASSLSAIGALIILFLVWKPKDNFQAEGFMAGAMKIKKHSLGTTLHAWSPYFLLVLFVIAWGHDPVKSMVNSVSMRINWPGLHGLIERMPPVVGKASPYDAVFNFNWLAASGTSCMFATILSGFILGLKPAQWVTVFTTTVKKSKLSMLTIASVLALAFLMNYSGATATLGLTFAATGAAFPFFSAMLGWLGVFLTGSDTSANALFGNLQVVTADKLGLDPVLMASSNSSGGVMGKMISLQSIAVAGAATGMKKGEEAQLFRFTVKHSIILASAIGLITWLYSSMR
ncbi:MAG: L-lactate permease [Acidobacteria bacterium]|nr:L-lactate permease [Acidobacteriota bacterium]